VFVNKCPACRDLIFQAVPTSQAKEEKRDSSTSEHTPAASEEF
jgi:hypothetical protein